MDSNLPTFYRFQEYYNDYDVFIECLTFKAVKSTKCGYWVVPEWVVNRIFTHENDIQLYKRFVYSKNARSWCNQDKQVAFKQFQIRKQYQLKHLKAKTRNIEAVLSKITSILQDNSLDYDKSLLPIVNIDNSRN